MEAERYSLTRHFSASIFLPLYYCPGKFSQAAQTSRPKFGKAETWRQKDILSLVIFLPPFFCLCLWPVPPVPACWAFCGACPLGAAELR